MRRGLFLLLALSLGLNGGLLYVRFAHRPPSDDRAMPLAPRPTLPRDAEVAVRDHLAGLVRDLDLTAAQEESIRAILVAHMPRMTELLRRTSEANRLIGEAFAAPEFDVEPFRQLVREASAARARADSLSAVMLLGEARILTPQQRARFARTAPTVYSTTHPESPPREGEPPSPRRQDDDRPPPRREDEGSPPPPRREDDGSPPPPRRGDDRSPPPPRRGDEPPPPRNGDGLPPREEGRPPAPPGTPRVR